MKISLAVFFLVTFGLPAHAVVDKNVSTGTDSDAVEAGAVEEGVEEDLSPEERLDALLAETIDAADYGESRRCLAHQQTRSAEILNKEYMLFRRGSSYWVNKLDKPCNVVRGDIIPSFNAQGTSQYCKGDQVWLVRRTDLNRGYSTSGIPLGHIGTCRLGAFEEISSEQAQLLKEAR